jgi:hypothetical protein
MSNRVIYNYVLAVTNAFLCGSLFTIYLAGSQTLNLFFAALSLTVVGSSTVTLVARLKEEKDDS